MIKSLLEGHSRTTAAEMKEQYSLGKILGIWAILQNIISGAFVLAFPSWRFRSTRMGVIVHSAQSVYFSFLILGVVLGLA